MNKQFYNIGTELGKNSNISYVKVNQLKDFILKNDTYRTVHIILEMYIDKGLCIPDELEAVLIDLLASKDIKDKQNLLSFLVGVYNASLN